MKVKYGAYRLRPQCSACEQVLEAYAVAEKCCPACGAMPWGHELVPARQVYTRRRKWLFFEYETVEWEIAKNE